MTIQVKRPSEGELKAMGVFDWPTWSKEVSTFDWHYDEPETCYVLEGRVTVEPKGGGDPVEIGPGDLVTFPRDLGCVWRVTEPIRKHYSFG